MSDSPQITLGGMLRRVLNDQAAAATAAAECDDVVPQAFSAASAHPTFLSADTHRLSVSLSRVLSLAAASGGRGVHGRFPSADRQLITLLDESTEGHLVLTVESAEPMSSPMLATVRWRLRSLDTVESINELVTPLGARRLPGALSARYDLGPVDGVEVVELEPAVAIHIAALDVERIRAAFRLGLRGSARTAWQQLITSGMCPAHVTEAIRQHLAAFDGSLP